MILFIGMVGNLQSQIFMNGYGGFVGIRMEVEETGTTEKHCNQ